jgi:hypothetical protein
MIWLKAHVWKAATTNDEGQFALPMGCFKDETLTLSLCLCNANPAIMRA